MTISPRERRSLAFAGVSVLLTILYSVLSPSDSAEVPKVVAPVSATENSEKRLQRLRDAVALLPAREEALKNVTAENKLREKGLLVADSAAQAQAQLWQILRRVARQEVPPIELKSLETGQVKPYGDAYGEASVSISVECKIEQLVNFLAQLTAQPEALSTSELHVNATNTDEKTLNVRLTVSGFIPKRLVPEKKGLAAF